MKKILLLLIPFIAAVLATHAQTVNYGIKGGLNLSNNTNNFSHYFPSFYTGGFAAFKLNKHWEIQPEILFSRAGATYEYSDGNKLKDRKNYINIPLMAKYYIIPNLYVEAGPQLDVLLSSKMESPTGKIDTRDSYRRLSLSAGAGIGYKLPYGLGVSARYMFGVSKMSQSGSLYTSNAQIGFNYTIPRKK